MGRLAQQFKMQPSEIDALDLDDFWDWLNEGVRQEKADTEALAEVEKKAGDSS